MEEQLILRAPPAVAAVLRRFCRGEVTGVPLTLEPLHDPRYRLHVGERTYAAMLVRLPTTVESHKLSEGGVVFKSGEISRMLYVWDEAESVDGAHASAAAPAPSSASSASSSSATSGGAAAASPPGLTLVRDPTPGAGSGDLVVDSGLTPPMAHAVQRRFRRATRFISRFTPEEVSLVERQLLDLMANTEAGSALLEHVVTELVDAEDWMGPWFASRGDNVTLVYEDGMLVDMYQLQSNEGAAKRFVKEGALKSAEIAPRIVRHNPDGTFGLATSATLGLGAGLRGTGAASGMAGPGVSSAGVDGGAGAGIMGGGVGVLGDSGFDPLAIMGVLPGADAFGAGGASAGAAARSAPLVIPGLMGLGDDGDGDDDGAGIGDGAGGEGDGDDDGLGFDFPFDALGPESSGGEDGEEDGEDGHAATRAPAAASTGGGVTDRMAAFLASLGDGGGDGGGDGSEAGSLSGSDSEDGGGGMPAGAPAERTGASSIASDLSDEAAGEAADTGAGRGLSRDIAAASGTPLSTASPLDMLGGGPPPTLWRMPMPVGAHGDAQADTDIVMAASAVVGLPATAAAPADGGRGADAANEAAVAAAEAGVTRLRAALAETEAKVAATSIPKLRERWEKEAAARRAELAAAEEALAALR